MDWTLVTGRLTAPFIIVHGGAGAYLKTTTPAQRLRRGARLLEVAHIGLEAMNGGGARAGVLAAVASMEADPDFNAGYGSKLQRDGIPRVSAGLADGVAQRVTAVFNVEGCLHPSALADALQSRGDRNIDGQGGAQLMAELGIVVTDLRTPKTVARWKSLLASGDLADPEAAIGDTGEPELEAAREAGVAVPEDLRGGQPGPRDVGPDERYGTVGAVAVDVQGSVWACTSTGGRGHEAVGRLTDSGMPAGNYAVPCCGVSATGFGEQIVDLDVAGRICVRALDGASVEGALRRTFDEVASHGGLLGAIAAHIDGTVGYAHTTEACGVAWADGAGAVHVDRHGTNTKNTNEES
jgi:L-asparaginase